jgi:hypothetical protein
MQALTKKVAPLPLMGKNDPRMVSSETPGDIARNILPISIVGV